MHTLPAVAHLALYCIALLAFTADTQVEQLL